MRRKPAHSIIQRHHITYEPSWLVHIRRTEHYVLTMLSRMKPPTKGFLKSLRYYILRNENKAVSGLKLKKDLRSVEKLKKKIKRRKK